MSRIFLDVRGAKKKKLRRLIGWTALPPTTFGSINGFALRCMIHSKQPPIVCYLCTALCGTMVGWTYGKLLAEACLMSMVRNPKCLQHCVKIATSWSLALCMRDLCKRHVLQLTTLAHALRRNDVQRARLDCQGRDCFGSVVQLGRSSGARN